MIVGDNERVVLIRKRRFESILMPGAYWVFGAGVEGEAHNTRYPELTSEWADFIATQRPETVAAHFTVVETGDSEVAVVYFDGKLARVVGPGKRVLYWRASAEVTFERIDGVAEPEVPARLVAPLARLGREALVLFALVDEGWRGLVHLDGRLIRELEAGAYAFWTVVAQPMGTITELRRQTLEVTGQEILTADKVAVRVNVLAVFQIVNATAARAGVTDVQEHLYRTIQIAVRQYLGKRTLEELPAEKQAQANLIRRLEEVAATRPLLNTAKLMGENPILVRLKELEALERIAHKVEKITVVGGMNALLERTVNIQVD